MSSPAGWYPDPGGRTAAFRYWDGRQWSAEVSTDPTAPPSTAGAVSAATQQRDALVIGPRRTRSPGRSGAARPWLTGLGALVLVIAVVVVLVVRSQSGGLEITTPRPGGSSTRELCPSPVQETPTDPAGSRVVSGQLSYPRLGAPFTSPTSDNRVPYGRNIRSQTAQVEVRPDGRLLWVAQIVIAQLRAGDGFYEPEQGAKIIADCVSGVFYGGVAVDRTDRRDEAIRIDGRSGWIIEAHLAFDVPDIETKGETMIIIVVETDDGAGLFYGSLPDTSPDYNEMIRTAMADLQLR